MVAAVVHVAFIQREADLLALVVARLGVQAALPLVQHLLELVSAVYFRRPSVTDDDDRVANLTRRDSEKQTVMR